jgi:long-chain fatty acid transport protein
MPKTSSTLRGLLALLLFTPTTNQVFANGIRLSSHNGFASARGEAFVATADNASAVYYNPAGITQMQGHNVSVGAYGIYLKPSYDSPFGGHYENEDPWHLAPDVFYAYTPKKFPLAFGLGLYSPYGLGVKWPQDTGFRTVATEGSVTYMTLSPVVAWKILPSLSVAAGPTFNSAETDLRQGLFPNPGDDEFRFKGDGMDVGYKLGARWQPLPQLAFGVTYCSESTIDYDGTTSMKPFYKSMDASAEFPFPQNVVIGVSYRPTPRWNIEFNADYTDWSRTKTLTIRQKQPVPPTILNWQSSWFFEAGATRYFDKGWRVSAGYIFNENSVPAAHYNPLVADLDRHFICAGAGYQGKHLGLDLTYQFGFGLSRTVSGSASSLAGQNADGDYEYLSHALCLTASWRF